VASDAPVEIRQAAAVNFKNHVKYHWVRPRRPCSPARPVSLERDPLPLPHCRSARRHCVPAGTGAQRARAALGRVGDPWAGEGPRPAPAGPGRRAQVAPPSSQRLRRRAAPCRAQDAVKASITGLMLSAPPAVRAQLSEALTIVSAHDFPAAWPALLPDLVARLRGADAGEVRGVLETANAIFKRYRNQFMTDALSAELQYSQQLVEPLLAVLRRLTAQARAPPAPAPRAPRTGPRCAACALKLLWRAVRPDYTATRALLCPPRTAVHTARQESLEPQAQAPRG